MVNYRQDDVLDSLGQIYPRPARMILQPSSSQCHNLRPSTVPSRSISPGSLVISCLLLTFVCPSSPSLALNHI